MKQLGFSLVELIISIMIIGIITAIAIPAYTSYSVKAKRTDAQIALMDTALRMEHYYNENHTYTGANLTNIGANTTSTHGYYVISITTVNASDFTLTATPQAGQANDTTCGNLTLNNLGVKGATGSAQNPSVDCW